MKMVDDDYLPLCSSQQALAKDGPWRRYEGSIHAGTYFHGVHVVHTGLAGCANLNRIQARSMQYQLGWFGHYAALSSRAVGGLEGDG